MFTQILDIAGKGVAAYGAAIAVVGIITFAEGNSQNAAAKKEEGFGKIVGGAIIIAVGVALSALLSSFLSF